MNDEQILIELGSKLLPSEIKSLVTRIKLDAERSGYERGVRESAEAIRNQTEKAFQGTTHMNSYGEGVKKGMKESADLALSLLTTKPEYKPS